MYKNRVHALWVLAWLSIAGASAFAAGTNAALKDTVVIDFSAQDYALMRARVVEALKAEPSSGVLDWKNEASRASGSVEPLQRETWSELPCKRLRIVNTLGSRTERGVYRFCEKTPGQWRLSGPVAGAR
jgi:hypothetical protein